MEEARKAELFKMADAWLDKADESSGFAPARIRYEIIEPGMIAGVIVAVLLRKPPEITDGTMEYYISFFGATLDGRQMAFVDGQPMATLEEAEQALAIALKAAQLERIALGKEIVNVNVVKNSQEALIQEAKKLYEKFMLDSKGSSREAVKMLDVVVLDAAHMHESLVVIKLESFLPEKKAYAAFMLAHKDVDEPHRLFPMGYKLFESLLELDTFISNVEFDIAAHAAGVNHTAPTMM